MIPISRALADPNLLGGVPFDLPSYAPWRAFLGACYGLDLDAESRRLFRACTGLSRYAPPAGGWPEVVLITGRQSGKTRAATALAVFEALVAQPSDSEEYVLLVAQDHRAALRTAFAYVESLVERSPVLKRAVLKKRSDSIRLETGVTLAAYPCRPESVRGLRARAAICDELGFYRGTDLRPLDRAMLTALRPSLATTGGRLVVLSSPYAKAGALYDLYTRGYAKPSRDLLAWRATAPQMNPGLSADYLRRMRKLDPEAYRSEVEGEFRSGLSALHDVDALTAVTDAGTRERPPKPETHYRAFFDASGGRKDAAALAIAHKEGETAVVDLLRAWPAPHNPSGVIAEVADLCRAYRVQTLTSDRFAAEFASEQIRHAGLQHRPAPKNASELHLELLSAVNSGTCALLDDKATLRELVALERIRGTAGRDRVQHPVGGHDDRAVAVAGAVYLARQRRGATMEDVLEMMSA